MDQSKIIDTFDTYQPPTLINNSLYPSSAVSPLHGGTLVVGDGGNGEEIAQIIHQ